MYARVDDRVLARLSQIVGPNDVLTECEAMAPYSHDETSGLSA